MKEKKLRKKPFWYRTSFYVFLYAFILAILMLMQAAISLCVKMDLTINNVVLMDFINGSLVLPINSMAWIWLGIASIYVGADRTMMFFKNIQETNTVYNMGEPKILRKVIFIAGILLLIAITCNGISDADFNLDAFASTFGTTILFYIAGQKAVATSKTLNSNIDTNSDGIDDSLQKIDVEGNIIYGSKKESDDDIVNAVNKEKTEDEKAIDKIKDVFSEPEAKETKDVAVNVLKAIIKNKDK